jgi:hypothetical protein
MPVLEVVELPYITSPNFSVIFRANPLSEEEKPEKVEET